MDYTVHGVAESQTGLSDFHFHFLSLPMLISPSVKFEQLTGVEQQATADEVKVYTHRKLFTLASP